MSNVPIDQLRYLRLPRLANTWTAIVKDATRTHPSYHKFLIDIIKAEYEDKTEKARLARTRRAKIPELLVMETFPFHKQPRLKKNVVFELYDSLAFVHDRRDLIFIGPTGCGKTGLATAFLVHAINEGFRGLFLDFKDLLGALYRSQGDYSEQKVMNRYLAYDVLLIDELGYIPGSEAQLSLFFDLMRRRHKRAATIITTQLGFDEWGTFLRDPHLTAALVDRITANCAVFNMKDCISIRSKSILYATGKHNSTGPEEVGQQSKPPDQPT